MKTGATQRARPTGALHHIRRSVLLLLGLQSHEMHTGIARYAREANWILDDSYWQTGQAPLWWRGDGILALITHPKDAEAQRHFPHLPLVDLSKGWIADTMPRKYRAAGQGRARVIYDNALIGQVAAEHFLGRGFKHIALFNFGNYWMEQERLPSFRRAVEQGGSRFHELPHYAYMPHGSLHPLRDQKTAHRWLIRTLRELPKPLGVATSSDRVALRVLRACDDAGLSVPEEVAVLGCHNEPLVCDYAPVPLSSVDDDLERVGYEGARLLDRLMDGEPAPQEPILIPPKGVVTRASTNIMAVPDVKAARGLRFIWEHFRENIGAPDVAAAAGLSRSALDRAFLDHIGRSAAQEILHLRIAEAKRLLIETNLKAHEIAARAGFNNMVHFSEAFLRVAGSRPSVFRHQGR